MEELRTNGLARKESIIRGENYRFTVLTSRMIRLEYSKDGCFEDRATKTVINRDFPVPEFRVLESVGNLEIITPHLHLSYNKEPFSKNGLNVRLCGNFTAYSSIWYYGDEPDDLKGTARTLDKCDGATELEHGLISYCGFSVIDDSDSILLNDDGWISTRNSGCTDIYFLGYGREYLDCLKDFFKLSGPTPLLPRYVLGNWWSRFYPYTEETYKELLDTFAAENIPFSVAILDMDWHLTQIDSHYGSAWTGYSWNRRLFPNPAGFLSHVHEKGMHVALNVHPADGVRAFEEVYYEMASALGVDPESGDGIRFDASNREFLKAYFKYLHHPNEDMGVDFWWIDWQQNGGSKIDGINPLWVLNHFHFLDNGRNGKRPIILSRYAGLGSHRYPVGFSGDTIITWSSLDFQPYFTATASNAGYCWWSHDIGGHMHGVKNDELAVRWLQFGVFSPIMRIHSSDNPFNNKLPWMYNTIAETVMKNFLRFRHKLVPYLYSMNYRCNEYGEPLVQPMYYRTTDVREAYEVPNQYYFGASLIACPITSPADAETTLAEFRAWLPDGEYFDIFSGMLYRGRRRINLYRDIYTIPVFAVVGSILPLCADDEIANSTQNPEHIELMVFAGGDGNFELYEDDGAKLPKSAVTKFEFSWNVNSGLKILTTGDRTVIPQRRKFSFRFVGFESDTYVTINGEPVAAGYDTKMQALSFSTGFIDTGEEIEISLDGSGKMCENDVALRCHELLMRAQIAYDLKDKIYAVITQSHNNTQILAELSTLGLSQTLFGALAEIVSA